MGSLLDEAGGMLEDEGPTEPSSVRFATVGHVFTKVPVESMSEYLPSVSPLQGNGHGDEHGNTFGRASSYQDQ